MGSTTTNKRTAELSIGFLEYFTYCLFYEAVCKCDGYILRKCDYSSGRKLHAARIFYILCISLRTLYGSLCLGHDYELVFSLRWRFFSRLTSLAGIF